MEIFEFRYCMQLLELSRRYPFKAHVWIGVFELFFFLFDYLFWKKNGILFNFELLK